MSLSNVIGNSLTQCRRARIPGHILQQCKFADRIVVENILTVLQDFVPHVNVTSCVLVVTSSGYTVTLPCAVAEVTVHQLLAVQDYSPARISDFKILVKDGVLNLLISIRDENCPVVYSEVAVLRVCKRTRYV